MKEHEVIRIGNGYDSHRVVEGREVLADRPKSAGEKPGGWFHIK